MPMLTLLTAVLSFQLAVPGTPDAILALSVAGPDSAIVAEARRNPDEARVALARLLALAALGADPAMRASYLARAERLAKAYTHAWHDSFLQQEAARFRRWPLLIQRRKADADSLRR